MEYHWQLVKKRWKRRERRVKSRWASEQDAASLASLQLAVVEWHGHVSAALLIRSFDSGKSLSFRISI